MKKIKITASYVIVPTEEMWFIVDVDDNNHILIGDDEFGLGKVWWQKWEGFRLDEFSDSEAIMVWENPDYADYRSTLDILNRRLAIGEAIRYVDSREHFIYRITNIVTVNS
ncbi:hypothetical protein SNN58_003539 [Cronobacter dublinensis]|uniref:hypothetical protein n=1 Tax=Cronobacter dublinensis TaxID=413497 RepID=UPI0024C45D21|nr:hypothetical protein [Cronobacter dublinensis]ELY2796668.1 hypothetical protein [Cronobacter dublinensis]ELY3971522.1 hypothetical protein [Cronobacter dublinensis]ELY4486763.1 hypothetical protein [Cronobacter dublinensis]ELY5824965.1 hypothetical protein [Cronobacter dublinensis]MDK1254568.1 hypothetical protein [Cronobacter dublinensis]